MFGALAQFETTTGVRLSGGRIMRKGRWNVFYEFSNRHQKGFPEDRNDIYHHRVRASHDFYGDSGWGWSIYAEGNLWDTEFNWSLGLEIQRRF